MSDLARRQASMPCNSHSPNASFQKASSDFCITRMARERPAARGSEDFSAVCCASKQPLHAKVSRNENALCCQNKWLTFEGSELHPRQVRIRWLWVDEWPLVRRIVQRLFHWILVGLRVGLRISARLGGLWCRRERTGFLCHHREQPMKAEVPPARTTRFSAASVSSLPCAISSAP